MSIARCGTDAAHRFYGQGTCGILLATCYNRAVTQLSFNSVPIMTSKKKIAADLQAALNGSKSFSVRLYAEVLVDYEDELKASLNNDADDALLCMLAENGDVAMMVINWDGRIYRNADALAQLKKMWRHKFDTNVQTIQPIFSEHISQNNLGVAGIKWLPQESV